MGMEDRTMKYSMKKILVVSVAVAITVLMMACGEEDQTEQMVQTSPQPNAYSSYNQGYGAYGYNNNGYGANGNFNYGQLASGYQAFPCNGAFGGQVNID